MGIIETMAVSNAMWNATIPGPHSLMWLVALTVTAAAAIAVRGIRLNGTPAVAH